MPDEFGPTTSTNNRLLARLPGPAHLRFRGSSEPITLEPGRVLYDQGDPTEHAYFPAGAAISALEVMEDGGSIEVATAGSEGVVGHHGALGGKSSRWRVVVQVGGGALRIRAAELRSEARRAGAVRELLDGYDDAFARHVSRSAACHGLHRLGPRCCSRLLATRDRVGSDRLLLTHESLSTMLGARRASVTEALAPLQEAGLVRSHRGSITILDGVGLEGCACDCYRAVKGAYDRLLGDRAGPC